MTLPSATALISAPVQFSLRTAARTVTVAGRAAGEVIDVGQRAVPEPLADLSGTLTRDLVTLFDPRGRRRQRRVSTFGDRVLAEVRGLNSSAAPHLTTLLHDQLNQIRGVRWVRVNAATGRVSVSFDQSTVEPAAIEAAIEKVEETAQTADQTWSRNIDHPADREPILAAALQLGGDVAGLVVALGGSLVPVPPAVHVLRAAVAAVDAQPRLRRLVERQLGFNRADLLITVGNAVGNALSSAPAGLVADGLQRAALLAETTARYVTWQQWEQQLASSAHPEVHETPQHSDRPEPLPGGPVENIADTISALAVAASGASLIGGRGIADMSDALLAGVPKAARSSRETFASVLSTVLAKHSVLTLNSSAWRRLDRVTAVVIDHRVLHGVRPMVVAAEVDDPAWSREHVWVAAQRLVTGTDRRELPIPPPRGRDGTRLSLLPDPTSEAGPQWQLLCEDDRPVGRVLVATEPDERAGNILAAARRAGLRVVLVGDETVTELRRAADQFVLEGGSVTELVQKLQTQGHGVAVLSAHAHRALDAADVAIGVSTRTPDGVLHLPWTADVICEDLATAERIIMAAATAREVSERGRVLATSAATLSGLLLAAGPAGSRRLRATSPIVAAQLTGIWLGMLAGARAGTGRIPTAVSLVPWHALEPDDVRSRLPEPRREATDSAGTDSRWISFTTPIPAPVSAAADRLGRPLRAGVDLARHVRNELADPLTPLLSVGAAASAILGSPTDAILVTAVLALNALVSARQHQRADASMQTLMLNERLSGRRMVAGQELSTAAEDLLPGDLIALRAGDVVPADARLVSSEALEMDESGLTGESVTVEKQVAATPGAVLADRSCMVFEGGIVVSGSARAVVVAVGDATEAGRALAVAHAPAAGGVQAQLRELSGKVLPLTLGGGAAVTALGFFRGLRLPAALADGVAVAVAAVPEGLPLVATVAQLAATRRLARRGVLVRSSRTVEALGRVDTLCFDKTGTLTEGRLNLVALADMAHEWDTTRAEDSPDARRLLRAAARACPSPGDGPMVHATDRAVVDGALRHLGKQAEHVWAPIEEIPFDSNRGYAASMGQTSHHIRLAVKGAPEVIVPRCSRLLRTGSGGEPDVVEMTAADRDRAHEVVRGLAERGLRVLAVARRDFTATPENMAEEVHELALMGFIGLADTPRPETKPLIHELARNDISVRMITGDHPTTARAVAEQLGIPAGAVTTGTELDELDEADQTELIERSTVFARVSPEHKVRIVAALQRSGHVVAMTGDGSNDAAAIRSADVGVGIATHGSAAARNAADLVMTTTDVTVLLDALVEGRGMWQRVRDGIGILVGGNAGEVAFTVLGTALTGRAPIGTRQFLLVNLLTDMGPAMAVALSSNRATDGMELDAPTIGAELEQLPRPELGGDFLRTVALRGAFTALGATAAWTCGRFTGPQRRAGTMALAALVGTQLGQTLLIGYRSPLVWATTLTSAALLATIIMIPGFSHFFGCTPLDPVAWGIVAVTTGGATLAAMVGQPLTTRLLNQILTPAIDA